MAMAGWPGLTASLLVLVLLISMSLPAEAKRTIKQSDALSNSNGCLGLIPKCEQGACATRNIMGTARWVCLRCLANYEPVVDSSGQDNIVQCVCPRGFFEPASNATRCSRCEAGSYCPGGDKAENPTSRGNIITCGANLVTRNTGARTQADCVAPAGFAQSSPGAASPCAKSEYAPQFNRLARCLRCQSGLEEPTDSGLAYAQRNNKKDVCKVPPGRYMSQGLVRWCPQGFYRENYTNFDAAVSQICLACKPGITTQGSGSKLASDCNVVLSGYGIQTFPNISSTSQAPPLPTNQTGGLPEASLCGIGFYSAGGYCLRCPYNTVTRDFGARSVEECVVPPGYFISAAAATMAPCNGGFYRERWVIHSDPRAQTCTPCGHGIQSEARDLDENPLAPNGTYARATSASCFIEAGQGMIAAGANGYVGSDCPANTYGAAGKVYGLTAAPCKPCPRNMITDMVRVNNSDECINPDGFGYASEGASRCAPGFYSLKGSRKPCQRCPFGRTTADDVSKQRLYTDCYVRPGFGLVSSIGNTTDGTGYLTNSGSLTDAAAAVMPVGECPIGYWGAGLSIRGVCTQCPTGSTTDEIARTAVDQCAICLPGYGIWESSACTPCNYGWYHPGGDTRCTQCPVATFYPPVDGVGDIWPSQSTTFFRGAQGIEFCVPKESQLSPDAGQIYFSAAVLPELTLSVSKPSLAACIATCPPNSGCMVQFDAAAGVCYYAALPWDPPGPSSPAGTKLQYKLPPGTLTSASSIKGKDSSSSTTGNTFNGAALVTPDAADAATIITEAGVLPDSGRSLLQDPTPEEATRVRAKMMASGFYARLAISADKVSSWLKAGVPLDPQRAQTFKWGAPPQWDEGKSEADCSKKCDDSVVCWGFLYNTTTQSCLYRGGEDALKSRSFFVMPNLASLDNGTTNTTAPPPLPPSEGPLPIIPPGAAGGIVDNATAPGLFNNGTITITSISNSTNTTNTTSPSNSNSTNTTNTGPSSAGGQLPTPIVTPSPSPSPSPSSTSDIDPEEQECLGRCKKSMCCLLQYNRDTKQCSLGDMECDNKDVNGNAYGQGYRITYKRDGPNGSPIGKAKSVQQYHRCKLQTQEMVDAYLKLGHNLDGRRAAQKVEGQQWVAAQNEQACRDVCSASDKCWGFIFYADPQDNKCLYKGGTDEEFLAGAELEVTYATYWV